MFDLELLSRRGVGLSNPHQLRHLSDGLYHVFGKRALAESFQVSFQMLDIASVNDSSIAIISFRTE
jgi:hypothetical protein